MGVDIKEPLVRRQQSRADQGLPGKKEWSQAWVGGLIVLAVAALTRFYDLTAAAIWGDEGSSLLMSRYDLTGIWVHAAHDVHPPLYFMLLHGWIEWFGDGIFSIRSLSALPGIAAVMLGMWLVRLMAGTRAALLAGLMLALLPTAVRYSQEVRMYSWLGVWLLGATIALVYWVKQPRHTQALVMYALLMTAGFYTHYFTALCVLVHWTYLLVLRLQPVHPLKLIDRPAWWLANVAIVMLFAPWIPGLIDLIQHMDQLKANGDVGWELPVTLSSLPSMVWDFLIQDDGDNLPWLLFSAVPILLLAVILMTVFRDRSRYRWSVVLALYTLLPLLLVYGVSFISPVFIERYLNAYALGLPLIMALAIDRLLHGFRIWAFGLLALFVGAELVGLKTNATVDVNDQTSVMVEFVNQHYVAGDRIVISDMLWWMPYVYYNRTDALPLLYTPPLANGRSSRPNDYGFGTLVNGDAHRIYLDHLSQLPRGTGRVWLISTADQPDEFAPLPNGWQKISETEAGNNRARLFVMGSESH
ncbi:glycosyltransferase family 39 protein [Pseudomonas izuensis]|uniref:glycosyltransferase family 39 protein n=1 Tax=Pseudomonas izuensis TaxID=2684212 RepID=UPI001359B0EB|nr:glycosyltransferase family 39 protein [Pseudomonas izuensis]